MNKLIKMATIVAGVGAMLCFAGCGSNGPDKVAAAFFEKFAVCDYDACTKYATPTTALLLETMKSMPIEEKLKMIKDTEGAKIEVVDTKIDGDNATVIIKITLKDGTVNTIDGKDAVTLIKRDGEWKVDWKLGN